MSSRNHSSKIDNAQNIRKLVLSIEGMTCSSCSNTVEAALNRTDGILSATVVLATNKGIIEYNRELVQASSLVELLEDIGFGGSIEDDSAIVTKQEGSLSQNNSLSNIKKMIMKCECAAERGLSTAQQQEAISAITAIVGVESAHFVDGFNIQISYNDEIAGPRTFYNGLAAIGLRSSAVAMGGFLSAGKMSSQRSQETEHAKWSFLLALLFTIPLVFLCDVLPMTGYLTANSKLFAPVIGNVSRYALLLVALCTPVQVGIGWKFHKKAIKSIQQRNLGMDFLVSTGTSAAYLYSLTSFVRSLFGDMSNSDMAAQMEDLMYFETAAVLITVVLLGKFLESYARGRTASAIDALTALRPKTARLVSNKFGHVLKLQTPSAAEGFQSGHHLNDFPDSAIEIDSFFIHKGDILRILEGDAIPADGIVLPLSTSTSSLSTTIGVDESMITGESKLAKRRPNEQVYGGTNCVEGNADILVNACGDESVLGKIVSTVQDAQASKPPIQEMADTVARNFVPAIALISLCTFVIWSLAWLANTVPVVWYGGSRTDPNSDAKSFLLYAFLFSLSVWVSACPCAFGLATPTAVLVATGLAARYGVLIRKGAALQFAADIDTVCFDKTGTLTCGKTVVSDFIVCERQPSTGSVLLIDSFKKVPNGYGQLPAHARLMRLLYSAEQQSSHPLAVGISQFCKNRLNDLSASDVDASTLKGELTVHPGQGIEFVTEAESHSSKHKVIVLVGSPLLLAAHSVDIPQQVMRAVNGLRAGGKVALLVAIDHVVHAIIGVSDMVRDESAAVVEALRRRGIVTYMITGDAQSTAHMIGSVIGIDKDHIFAGTKPKDKETIVSALVKRGRKVAFVGDGTNDSPALARASVGIAMSSGSSIAIESGDMVLCNNDLNAVVVALDLSVKTMRRIKINYIWALVYNLCLVPVAAGVFVPSFGFHLAPTMAGMAMAASSVSIVVSSLLLQLYNPPSSLIPEDSNRYSDADMDESGSPRSANELIIEKCNCPVSTAPKFQLVEESWSDKVWEQMTNLLSNLMNCCNKNASYVPITDVDDSQSVAIEIKDEASTIDDEHAIELMELVDKSLNIYSSTRTPADRNPLKPTKSKTKTQVHRCSCGKMNCRCGEDCQCGIVA